MYKTQIKIHIYVCMYKGQVQIHIYIYISIICVYIYVYIVIICIYIYGNKYLYVYIYTYICIYSFPTYVRSSITFAATWVGEGGYIYIFVIESAASSKFQLHTRAIKIFMSVNTYLYTSYIKEKVHLNAICLVTQIKEVPFPTE